MRFSWLFSAICHYFTTFVKELIFLVLKIYKFYSKGLVSSNNDSRQIKVTYESFLFTQDYLLINNFSLIL